ncbi:MAG: protein kinase domain-containing protein, partial [Myxococcales bacterium]
MLEGLQPVMALGQGGEGAVRLAWDPSLARFLAVKTVRIAGDSREAGERVLARFAPFAQVIDTGLAALLACGLSDGAPPPFRERFGLTRGLWLYAVLPYVHALDAAELGGGQPLSAKVVAALGAEVAQILERLHGRDLAHLDLKPPNVLVDCQGPVVLVDFHSATPAGTSGYAAPEQGGSADLRAEAKGRSIQPEQGSGGDGGPAADWFSLSRTLLAVWSGEAIEAGRPLPDPPEPAPSLSAQERLAHGALAQLIERLGSSDPGERRGNAAEFERLAAELGAGTDGGGRQRSLAAAVAASPRRRKLEEIEARQRDVPSAPVPPPTRAGPATAAHRLRLLLNVLLSSLALTLAGAVVWALWPAHRSVVLDEPAPQAFASPAPSEPAPPQGPKSCAFGEILAPDLVRFLCPGEKPRPDHGSLAAHVSGPSGTTTLSLTSTGQPVWRLTSPRVGQGGNLELVPHHYRWTTPTAHGVMSDECAVAPGTVCPSYDIN